MMASGIYGVLLGIAFVVFTKLVPQPIGSVILWAFFGVQLSWGAVTCWRRTGLPFASAALITGAMMSTCALILAVVGHPYPRWPPESWVLFGGGAVLGPLFLFIESRVNRAKWKQWAQHMERQRVWDIVTGRHFPKLRNGGA
jgi:hypothetical protein